MTRHAPSNAGDSVLTSAFNDINGLYDAFINSLLQVNSSTGTIGSAAVIQGYQLAQVLRGPKEVEKDKDGNNVKDQQGSDVETYPHPAYILLASVTNAGGTTHTHKNLGTALWSGDKITYSGGLVVNVALWTSADSRPMYVHVLRYRTPFTTIASPADTTNVNVGDDLNK